MASARGAHIIVVGGGIGGATASLALLQAGFRVSLFEQAPAMGEVGAGLTVQPSATRAVDYLGLGQTFRTVADPSQGSWVYHGKTGAVISELMSKGNASGDGEGTRYFRVLRADLLAILVAAIERASPDTIRLGRRIERVQQDDEGGAVILADGSVVRGDAVIGADGSRSPIRAQLFGAGDPQFRGQVAYRCLIPMKQAAPVLGERSSGTYIGPGGIFNQYPVRQDTILNCIGIVRTDTWTQEGWSTPATRDEFAAEFAGWHDSLTGLLALAPREGLGKWALYDRDPLPRWTNGRVTLLGDAAHPILPFLGLAGAMAVEDAVVLARACAASPDDLPAALLVYERARLPRTTRVLLMSRAQGEVYQSDDTDGYATKTRPNLDPDLYSYDPATVAL